MCQTLYFSRSKAELTVSSNGKIKPLISCDSSRTPHTTHAGALVPVTPAIKGTDGVNPVQGVRPRSKLNCFGLPNHDSTKIKEQLDTRRSFLPWAIQLLICTATVRRLDSFKVDHILDRQPKARQRFRGTRSIEVKTRWYWNVPSWWYLIPLCRVTSAFELLISL
jgi:hypothetical protein